MYPSKRHSPHTHALVKIKHFLRVGLHACADQKRGVQLLGAVTNRF